MGIIAGTNDIRRLKRYICECSVSRVVVSNDAKRFTYAGSYRGEVVDIVERTSDSCFSFRDIKDVFVSSLGVISFDQIDIDRTIDINKELFIKNEMRW